jgi:hypothetical protein
VSSPPSLIYYNETLLSVLKYIFPFEIIRGAMSYTKTADERETRHSALEHFAPFLQLHNNCGRDNPAQFLVVACLLQPDSVLLRFRFASHQK